MTRSKTMAAAAAATAAESQQQNVILPPPKKKLRITRINTGSSSSSIGCRRFHPSKTATAAANATAAADAPANAARVLQRWWRRVLSKQKERRDRAEAVDPITLEPIAAADDAGSPSSSQPLPPPVFRFVSKQHPHAVSYFDASNLASCFSCTLKFENPLTREKFNLVEVRRLHKLTADVVPDLMSTYRSADKLLADLEFCNDEIEILGNEVDYEISELSEFGVLVCMQANDFLGSLVGSDLISELIQRQAIQKIISYAHNETLPNIRVIFHDMYKLLLSNNRVSPDVIALKCQTLLTHYNAVISPPHALLSHQQHKDMTPFDLTINNFFRDMQHYYSTEAVQSARDAKKTRSSSSGGARRSSSLSSASSSFTHHTTTSAAI